MSTVLVTFGSVVSALEAGNEDVSQLKTKNSKCKDKTQNFQLTVMVLVF